MSETNVTTEIATIERAMADRHSDYWSGPKVDGETVMARRYRELVSRAEGNADSALHEEVALGDAAPQWQTETGIRICREWQKSGGIERNHAAAMRVAREIVDALPAETRADFVAQVDGLPAGLQVALAAELANPYAGAATATAKQIRNFAGSGPGAELVREWGRAAAQRLAKLNTRLGRIRARLSDADREAFAHFADAISGAEFKALANYLTK